jgi:DNA-binding CsgD family transcriptional regulator
MNRKHIPLGRQSEPEISRYIKLISDSETAYDVFRILKDICHFFGYLKFIVFKLDDDFGDNPIDSLESQAIVTNWDPELIRAYDAMKLFTNSPVLSALRKSTLPICWKIESLNQNRPDGLDSQVNRLFKDFGLVSGVYVNVSNKFGSRGALGLSGDAAHPSLEDLMRLTYLAGPAFEKLTDLEELVDKTKFHLTDRERECVYWTAAGKSSGEVGIILGISENTVNHHMTSSAHKLGTVNKAHTVAKAIRHGLLSQ